MAYSKVIFLLPLFYLLTPIAGQILQYAPNGTLIVSKDKMGSQNSTVCFIEKKDVAPCGQGETTIISLRGYKGESAKYRSNIVDDIGNMFQESAGKIAKWQVTNAIYGNIFGNMQSLFGNPERNGFYTVPPMNAPISQPFFSPYYFYYTYGNYLYRSNQPNTMPKFMPMDTTKCLPSNNPICTEEQIKAHDDYMAEALPKSRAGFPAPAVSKK